MFLNHDHLSQVSAPVEDGSPGFTGSSQSVSPQSDDHAVAHELARAAGALLLEVRAELVAAGAEERTIKDTGDLTKLREAITVLDKQVVEKQASPEDSKPLVENIDLENITEEEFLK